VLIAPLSFPYLLLPLSYAIGVRTSLQGRLYQLRINFSRTKITDQYYTEALKLCLYLCCYLISANKGLCSFYAAKCVLPENAQKCLFAAGPWKV